MRKAERQNIERKKIEKTTSKEKMISIDWTERRNAEKNIKWKNVEKTCISKKIHIDVLDHQGNSFI
jgi:hypothetical protein